MVPAPAPAPEAAPYALQAQSNAEIQRLAHSALKAGNTDTAVNHIAGAGTYGKWPSNVERDLQRKLQRVMGGGLEPYLAPVRLRRDEDEGEIMLQVPMFPVHEWLANLWEQGGTVFNRAVLPPGGVPALAEFWDKVKECEWARAHPAMAVVDVSSDAARADPSLAEGVPPAAAAPTAWRVLEGVPPVAPHAAEGVPPAAAASCVVEGTPMDVAAVEASRAPEGTPLAAVGLAAVCAAGGAPPAAPGLVASHTAVALAASGAAGGAPSAASVLGAPHAAEGTPQAVAVPAASHVAEGAPPAVARVTALPSAAVLGASHAAEGAPPAAARVAALPLAEGVPPAAAGSLAHTIPWGLFGDDVGVYKHDKIMVLLCHSLLAVERAVLTRLVVALLPYAWFTENTMDDVYQAVAWGFQWLLEGRWATHDHLGQEIAARHGAHRWRMRGKRLAGPFRGAFLRSGGDWKWNKETYHLKAYGHTQCCHKCGATKNGPLSFADFRRTAAHRSTLKDHGQFMMEQRAQGTADNPLFQIPGWRMEFLWVDIMHCVFQGFGQRVAASVIVDLLLEGFWGPLPGHKFNNLLRVAWRRFKMWCARRGVATSQPCFTRTRLCWETRADYPDLKGKAWACRCILAWLADITFSGRARGLRARKRAELCWGLADICHCMDCAATFLTEEETRKFQRGGRVALASYSWLARDALDREVCNYALKPKMHQFDHLLSEVGTDRLNPAVFWNFADESLLGDLKRIVSRCHRSTLVQRTLQRYSLRLQLLWEKLRNPMAETLQFCTLCGIELAFVAVHCRVCRQAFHRECLGFLHVCNCCRRQIHASRCGARARAGGEPPRPECTPTNTCPC